MSDSSPVGQVGPYPWEELLERIRSFHGHAAPGVVIGGVMLSTAREQLPKDILFDAICESIDCLPDAVQIFTPCTVGNGWLKVINLGRFAISLYDKYNGSGVRIYLNPEKLKDWDEIRNWYLKLKPKHEQDTGRLLEQIKNAGTGIYTLQPVQIKAEYLVKHSKGLIEICSVCGEAYPARDGAVCLGCQGEAPY